MYIFHNQIGLKSLSASGVAPADLPSEMEGVTLGEGSSQADWKNLFRKCPEAREIILDGIDLESALTCRLVCKDWRIVVNYYRKLWTKIKKVSSITIHLF